MTIFEKNFSRIKTFIPRNDLKAQLNFKNDKIRHMKKFTEIEKNYKNPSEGPPIIRVVNFFSDPPPSNV